MFKVLVAISVIFLTACGGTGIGNPQNGNVSLQTHQLAGADAALNSLSLPGSIVAALLGIRPAYGAVSSFNKFQVCLSSITFEQMSGQPEQGDRVLSPGLVTFSPTNTSPMSIGSLYLTPGSTLKNVKFVIATVPELCQGANFAVLFNGPSSGGDISITQDVSFRFDFPGAGYTVSGDGQTIDLLLGDIVNGMVSLGSGLNNSTIQTVNVGQAQ